MCGGGGESWGGEGGEIISYEESSLDGVGSEWGEGG